MQKLLTSLLCAFMLAGCFARKENSTNFAAYEGFYKSILDNDKFQEGSLYYQISAEMSTLADGTHRYYIFLDDAQIAMYDVVMLAVEGSGLLCLFFLGCCSIAVSSFISFTS